jgi:WD40 repeat protein
MRITTVFVVALILLAPDLLTAEFGQLQRTLNEHSGYVLSVGISPDGKRIVSGSADRTIRIWDFNTGKLQKTIAGQTREIESVAFSHDGKHIVSGSADGTIKIWDAVE